MFVLSKNLSWPEYLSKGTSFKNSELGGNVSPAPLFRSKKNIDSHNNLSKVDSNILLSTHLEAQRTISNVNAALSNVSFWPPLTASQLSTTDSNLNLNDFSDIGLQRITYTTPSILTRQKLYGPLDANNNQGIYPRQLNGSQPKVLPSSFDGFARPIIPNSNYIYPTVEAGRLVPDEKIFNVPNKIINENKTTRSGRVRRRYRHHSERYSSSTCSSTSRKRFRYNSYSKRNERYRDNTKYHATGLPSNDIDMDNKILHKISDQLVDRNHDLTAINSGLEFMLNSPNKNSYIIENDIKSSQPSQQNTMTDRQYNNLSIKNNDTQQQNNQEILLKNLAVNEQPEHVSHTLINDSNEEHKYALIEKSKSFSNGSILNIPKYNNSSELSNINSLLVEGNIAHSTDVPSNIDDNLTYNQKHVTFENPLLTNTSLGDASSMNDHPKSPSSIYSKKSDPLIDFYNKIESSSNIIDSREYQNSNISNNSVINRVSYNQNGETELSKETLLSNEKVDIELKNLIVNKSINISKDNNTIRSNSIEYHRSEKTIPVTMSRLDDSIFDFSTANQEPNYNCLDIPQDRSLVDKHNDKSLKTKICSIDTFNDFNQSIYSYERKRLTSPNSDTRRSIAGLTFDDTSLEERKESTYKNPQNQYMTSSINCDSKTYEKRRFSDNFRDSGAAVSSIFDESMDGNCKIRIEGSSDLSILGKQNNLIQVKKHTKNTTCEETGINVCVSNTNQSLLGGQSTRYVKTDGDDSVLNRNNDCLLSSNAPQSMEPTHLFQPESHGSSHSRYPGDIAPISARVVSQKSESESDDECPKSRKRRRRFAVKNNETARKAAWRKMLSVKLKNFELKCCDLIPVEESHWYITRCMEIDRTHRDRSGREFAHLLPKYYSYKENFPTLNEDTAWIGNNGPRSLWPSEVEQDVDPELILPIPYMQCPMSLEIVNSFKSIATTARSIEKQIDNREEVVGCCAGKVEPLEHDPLWPRLNKNWRLDCTNNELVIVPRESILDRAASISAAKAAGADPCYTIYEMFPSSKIPPSQVGSVDQWKNVIEHSDVPAWCTQLNNLGVKKIYGVPQGENIFWSQNGPQKRMIFTLVKEKQASSDTVGLRSQYLDFVERVNKNAKSMLDSGLNVMSVQCVLDRIEAKRNKKCNAIDSNLCQSRERAYSSILEPLVNMEQPSDINARYYARDTYDLDRITKERLIVLAEKLMGDIIPLEGRPLKTWEELRAKQVQWGAPERSAGRSDILGYRPAHTIASLNNIPRCIAPGPLSVIVPWSEGDCKVVDCGEYHMRAQREDMFSLYSIRQLLKLPLFSSYYIKLGPRCVKTAEQVTQGSNIYWTLVNIERKDGFPPDLEDVWDYRKRDSAAIFILDQSEQEFFRGDVLTITAGVIYEVLNLKETELTFRVTCHGPHQIR